MSAVTYKELFAGNIYVSLKTAAALLAEYPSSVRAFTKISKGLKKAQKLREVHSEGGGEIPAMMIVSTTDACNLSCAGCYARAQNRPPDHELSFERISQIMSEASELGVRVVMLAGGEPLMSQGWLDALAVHSEMAGVVFTNGTLLDEERRLWFNNHRHIVPVFSIEGNEEQTDARRGTGVFAAAAQAMQGMKMEGIPFGISVTVTRQNIDSITTDAFAEEYIKRGCRLFIFVEYVPAELGSEPLALSESDKKRLSGFAEDSSKKFPALFIPFPGDEEQYGGCLAAGRGFIHVSSGGDVEPCPFAPFSDSNLKRASLKEALTSVFLLKVRENSHLLKESGGGCALWNNSQVLKDLKMR